MASIIDVAKVAGVGKSTVSRYLNDGYVSQENKEKIERAIKQLDYAPCSLGRMLQSGRPYSLALCVPMITHPYFSRFTEALESKISDLGSDSLSQLVVVVGKDREKLHRLVARKQIEGLILLTHNDIEDEEALAVNTVSIDRVIGKNTPCVTSDNYESTIKALEYLYGLGDRKILFIGGRPSVESQVTKRFDAYCDFCSKYGIDKVYAYEDYLHGEEYQNAERFLKDKDNVDAIFATSDTFGFASYRYYKDNAKSVPHIITYDGVMDEFIQRPSFTSVKQDVDKMAEVALSLLIKKINGEKCEPLTVIATSFKKGETA